MILNRLFETTYGEQPVTSLEIFGSGSARRYYRLQAASGFTVIGTVGTDTAENCAFIYLDGVFRELGIHVARVIAVSDDETAYLQEDLGDCQLLSLITEHPDAERTAGLLRETVSLLPDLQFKGGRAVDFSRCYPVAEFDRRSVMWDLNYFKYSFLKPSGVEFDESRLEDDLETLATLLLSDKSMTGFMYRDFQSRNVMVYNDAPWFIDFQGGRRGPVLYDLASFLWQAKAGFSDATRQELALTYKRSAIRYCDTGTDNEFMARLRLMALFRTLQVLGAYGFRGLVGGKPHFIESIPAAVENLRGLLDALTQGEFTELERALRAIVELPQYQPRKATSGLVVEVNSFGFRKSGIPRDYTGNGGGYVFDCRAVTNPGRYDQYKPLTGLDAPVKEFLEQGGEIQEFLESVRRIVGHSVRRYMERGFSNLKVSFGCTGGRHRSVYSAQNTAEWISETFGVEVELHHIEQNIHQHFPRR